MADKKYGIILTAKDKASKAIKGVGDAAGHSSKAVRALGTGGAAALKSLGFAAIAVNQAIEIVKKFKDMMVLASEMSMQYRKENDPLIKQFKEARNLVGSLAARVGDVLVAAFSQATKALGPVIKNTRLWLVENQKMLAAGIINFLKKTAQVLTKGVSKSILFATKATLGWRLIWLKLRGTVETVFGSLLTGISEFLLYMAKIETEWGRVDLAAKFAQLGGAARGLAKTFKASAVDAENAIDPLIKQQKELEARVDRISTKFKKGIGEVAKTAVDGLAEGTKGLNVTLEETEKAVETVGDKTTTVANDSGNAWASAAGQVGSSMVTAFASSENAATQFEAAILSSITATVAAITEAAIIQITSNSAVASSGAAASQSMIPIVGPALAAGAAAAMTLLVSAFKGDVPKPKSFNRGGIVPGVGNSDTVPSLLTPGELVIPKDMTKKLLAVAKQSPRDGQGFSNGGIVRAQGGGGVVVNFNESSIMPRTPAEHDKWIKEKLVPSLQRLRRRGVAI